MAPVLDWEPWLLYWAWSHGCCIGRGSVAAVLGVEPWLLYLLDFVLNDILCIADFGLPVSAVVFWFFFFFVLYFLNHRL